MQMKLCSLARPPRTSRYAAWPLTDHGPVPVHGLGDGDPDIEGSLYTYFSTALDTRFWKKVKLENL